MKLTKIISGRGCAKLSSICTLALLEAAVLLPLGTFGDALTLGNEMRSHLPFIPSPLASLTVTDMRGFTGSLVGYGTITVEKGATLNKSRVTIANTLTVNVLGTGMTIIIR